MNRTDRILEAAEYIPPRKYNEIVDVRKSIIGSNVWFISNCPECDEKNTLYDTRSKPRNIKYECEYLTEERSIKAARMLWCIDNKTQTFTKLPEDPALEGSDDSNQSEHYLELKARIAKGDYPDLSELESPEEFQLILPGLIDSGIIQFNRETGGYTVPEEIQAKLDKMTKD